MKEYLTPEIDLVIYGREDVLTLSEASTDPAPEQPATNGEYNAEGSAKGWTFDSFI